MTREYRAVIVGAGRKAGFIDDERQPGDRAWLKPWTHASAYQAVPGCRVVAAADPKDDKLQALCDRYGIPGRYHDYREMIEREQPDLVSITTWAGLHAEVTIFAAEHGARAIYTEKALACSMAEADAMRAACRRHRVAFNYGAGRRYRPGYRQMRQMGETGQLGDVRGVIVNCGMGGLMHGQSHMVDTALHLLGDPEPEFAQGYIQPASGPDGEPVSGHFDAAANRWLGRTEAEGDPRLASAYVRFTNGMDTTIWANGGRWYTFTLVGTTGLAHAYDNNSAYESRRIANSAIFRSESVPFPPFEDESDTVVAIRELIGALEADDPQRTSGNIEIAHRGTEILFAVAQSHLEDGRRITFPLSNRTMYVPSR